MFLSRLPEPQKVAFLQLAHYVARVDDEFSDKEVAVIQSYCAEMSVDDIDFRSEEFDLIEAASAFQVPSHQKIALLELMALAFSDGNYDLGEESAIEELFDYFGFDADLAIVYKEWARSMIALSAQGEALIRC